MLDLLETAELVSNCELVKLLHDRPLHVFFLANLFVIQSILAFLREVDRFFDLIEVWNDDCDQV